MRSPVPLSQDALYGRGPFLRPGCVVPPISGTTAPSAARRPPGDFTVVAYTPGPLPGRGAPEPVWAFPQFPHPPSDHSDPHTPGVPGRLLFQVFGAFRGLRRDKS